ncbi:MAG: AAA family ATPase [Bacteroidota bacterium]
MTSFIPKEKFAFRKGNFRLNYNPETNQFENKAGKVSPVALLDAEGYNRSAKVKYIYNPVSDGFEIATPILKGRLTLFKKGDRVVNLKGGLTKTNTKTFEKLVKRVRRKKIDTPVAKRIIKKAPASLLVDKPPRVRKPRVKKPVEERMYMYSYTVYFIEYFRKLDTDPNHPPPYKGITEGTASEEDAIFAERRTKKKQREIVKAHAEFESKYSHEPIRDSQGVLHYHVFSESRSTVRTGNVELSSKAPKRKRQLKEITDNLFRDEFYDNEGSDGVAWCLLETRVTSLINTETKKELLSETLLYNDGKMFQAREKYIPHGTCVPTTLRNGWGKVHRGLEFKAIHNDKWLCEALGVRSLDAGCRYTYIERVSKKILEETGRLAPYYILDSMKNIVDVCPYIEKVKDVEFIKFMETTHTITKKSGKVVPWTLQINSLPSIILFIHNNHISEVVDEDLKESVRKRVGATKVTGDGITHTEDKKKNKQVMKKETEKANEKNVIYIQYEKDLVNKVLELNGEHTNTMFVICDVKETGIFQSEPANFCMANIFKDIILFSDGVIPYCRIIHTSKDTTNFISIALDDGNEVVVNANVLAVQRICKAHEIPFKNQSVPQLSKVILDKIYDGVLPMSTFDKFTYDLLESNKPCISKGKFIDIPVHDQVCYDKRKNYTEALYNMSGDFAVFDIFNQWEEYDAEKSNNGNSPGAYFIENENVFPCKGNGVFSHVTVQFLQKQKIPHVITHMLIAGKRFDKAYFQKFIDEVRKTNSPKDAKSIVNMMIGTLKKKSRRQILESIHASTYSAALDFYQKMKTSGYESTISQVYSKDIHGFDLFRVIKYSQSIDLNTLSYIRRQVMEQANIAVYDLAVIMTGGDFSKIVSMNTDCVAIRKSEFTSEMQKVLDSSDKYSASAPPTNFSKVVNMKDFLATHNMSDYSTWKKQVDNFEGLGCEELDKFHSARIQGGPGDGKSYILRNFYDYLTAQGLNVKKIAFQNRAADNVDGRTIHKTLGLWGKNGDMRVSETGANIPDVLLVDEISQVTGELWKRLYVYSLLGSRIFLFGDVNQIPPVEGKETGHASFYLESQVVKEIAKGNLIILHKNYRAASDPMMKTYLGEILENGSARKEFFRQTETDLNICATNRRCRQVNKVCMERYSKSGKDIWEVKKMENEKNDYDIVEDFSQDLVISRGVPFVARKNFTREEVSVIKGSCWIAKGIFNGKYVFENPKKGDVLEFDIDNVTKTDTKGRQVECNLQEFLLCGFAMTVHKAQGQTFDKPFTIHEWGHRMFVNINLRYTAFSRATHSNLVSICMN